MQDRFNFRIWDKENEECIYFQAGYSISFDIAKYLNSDRYIVEQCTGLKDKNGKLIYEGDIIQQKSYTTGHFNIIGVVRFNKAAQFCIDHIFKRGDSFDWKIGTKRNFAISTQCEIIGNVHEHSSLLESEGK